jgi:hypothetical protein
MKLLEFVMTGKYSFKAVLMKWKSKYSIEGTFRTTVQDYPNESEAPLYASTLNFTILDEKGKDYMSQLSDNENQEVEDLLNDEIDSHIESNEKSYRKP